jgi:hypothetical protein
MTATVASPELSDTLAEIVDEIGPYPHAALNPDESGKKKQGTRMLKLACPACGYAVRTTAKWIDVGFPTCPCGTEMRGEDVEDV